MKDLVHEVTCICHNHYFSAGTGDIVTDMENQVKANTVRIQVLEEQNETLRNSVSKVLSLQQGPSPPKVAWEKVSPVP